MCGIAGIFSLDPLAAAEAGLATALEAMVAAVAHRGPDQQGCFAEAGCLLGHRRLAIIDLSESGRQPMAYQQRYLLSFNGEIYNYLELRARLEAQGYAFASDSDSEVLLAAYAHWGPACQQELQGMWAFLIYDRERQSLFVSRDRFGIKPLYYWISPEGFVAFASEIKQFTVLPGWRARARSQRLYDFLAWNLSDHSDETLFAGVYQLPPGSCLSLGRPLTTRPGGRLVPQTWYRLAATPFSGDFASAERRYYELFAESIALHLRADVPIGSCLSGGLDSSAIVGMVRHQLDQSGSKAPQLAFSARFTEPRLDESAYIDAVVAMHGIEAHGTDSEPGRLAELLPRLVWHQDEPTGSASVYAQWQVFALARAAGVKVMLDGQGADEGIGGYHAYLALQLTGLLRRGQLGAYRSLAGQLRARYGYRPAQLTRWSLNRLLPEALRRPLRRLAGLETPLPDWLAPAGFDLRPGDPLAALEKPAQSLSELSIVQLQQSHLPRLLHWEDRNSMAHSIEARVPFLHHPLVEFLLGLPEDYRIHQGLTKHIQREALRDLLPAAVYARADKLGFEPPEAGWLRALPWAQLQPVLQQAVSGSQGLLRPAVLARAEAIHSGRLPYDGLLWRLLNLGHWLEAFAIEAFD